MYINIYIILIKTQIVETLPIGSFSPAFLLPRTTNPEFPKRGVFFTPHPLKLVTIAGLEKNLLQRSRVLTPKKPIHH